MRATTYWHASRVLAEQKRWDEALDYATRARVLMEELEDHEEVQSVASNFDISDEELARIAK